MNLANSRAIGFTCAYTPIPLIEAAGFKPYRLLPMVRALQLDIGEMIDLDLGVEGKITLSSMCTVFAESEVVSLIADGVDVREIVHGLNSAIASRTVSLVKRIVPNPEGITVAMSGGVARNSGVVRALEAALGFKIAVPAEPDTIGAYGAALFARQRSQ